MADVNIECRNFRPPYASINGQVSINVTFLKYLRAVVTVGFQHMPDLLSASIRTQLYRLGVGLGSESFLTYGTAGLALSSDFYLLDGSEKGVLSYWYGMALAKIVGELQLNVPWLGHVDSLGKAGLIPNISGKTKRGDLAGLDSGGNWHVIEAKGRSNHYSQSDVTKAKTQASRITSIAGVTPSTTSACIVRVDVVPISILLDDPPENPEGSQLRLEIQEDRFIRHYYSGLTDYIRQFREREITTIAGRRYVVAPLFVPMVVPFLPLHRLRVGIADSIFVGELPDHDWHCEPSQDDTWDAGTDGIVVFTQGAE